MVLRLILFITIKYLFKAHNRFHEAQNAKMLNKVAGYFLGALPEPVSCRVREDVLLVQGSPASEEEGPDLGVDSPLPGLDPNTENEREDDDVLLSSRELANRILYHQMNISAPGKESDKSSDTSCL